MPNIFDELLQVDVKNKERFQELFSETVKKIKLGNFSIVVGEEEKEDYYLVTEDGRFGGYFIHIVPKEIYGLFKKMQAAAPNDLLGFSVLGGKHNNKDVRVSCFGVQCNLLGKALFKKALN